MNYYMDYNKLYLKYKTKYLSLKNKLGGGDVENTEMNPHNIYKNFIKSTITLDEFVKLYNEIKDEITRINIINELKTNPNINIDQLKEKLNIL